MLRNLFLTTIPKNLNTVHIDSTIYSIGELYMAMKGDEKAPMCYQRGKNLKKKKENKCISHPPKHRNNIDYTSLKNYHLKSTDLNAG